MESLRYALRPARICGVDSLMSTKRGEGAAKVSDDIVFDIAEQEKFIAECEKDGMKYRAEKMSKNQEYYFRIGRRTSLTLILDLVRNLESTSPPSALIAAVEAVTALRVAAPWNSPEENAYDKVLNLLRSPPTEEVA